MPELPEVQTIVNDLNEIAKNEVIASFWSGWEKGVKVSVRKLNQGVANSRIIGARRIGKHIILDLDNAHSIIIHLKMTGHLLFINKKRLNNKLAQKVNGYVRHMLCFESGNRLDFSDLRKFGWINFMKTIDVLELASIKRLGIDATRLNEEAFLRMFGEKNRSNIGLFLLKQEIISGIGNIYRSEILFESGILPNRRCNGLKILEIKKLFRAINKILNLAIKLRGTSDSDYRDTRGEIGRFQEILHVYRRDKKACKVCNNIILKGKIGQRSVFYCETCQE